MPEQESYQSKSIITCFHPISLRYLERLVWLTGNLRHVTTFSRVSILRSKAEPVYSAFNKTNSVIDNDHFWGALKTHQPQHIDPQKEKGKKNAQMMLTGHSPPGGHWAQNWCFLSCNSVLRQLLSVSRFKSWDPEALKGLTCWEIALRSLPQDLLF